MTIGRYRRDEATDDETREKLGINGQPKVNGTKRLPTEWNDTDWRKATEGVNRLRQRIFRATQEKDFKKVRSLQKLMLRSYSNRLVSVRRVAQQNTGSRTPGVDKVLAKTPKSRGMLVDQLATFTPWKAAPTRRVYIPKANGKQRPLGIPTLRDRALQAMVKNALEPSWEARFEATSYGFRPGRSCHDAIARIYVSANPNSAKRWVLDADIKGAFDNISHEHLLRTIGKAPGWGLIKQWLKAGYMEMGTLHQTSAGTPQGGVISPLLANIALHGMEQALGIKRIKHFKINPTGRNREYIKRGHPTIVRYADDFVVLCETQEQAQNAQSLLSDWLAERGLTFSEEKTQICQLSEGFDFLGFNIRHYKNDKKPKGFSLNIRISRDAMQKIRDRLREEWKRHLHVPPAGVCSKFNPIIRGWTNYFRIGVASKQFNGLDNWMWTRAKRYAKLRHPNHSGQWRSKRYWGKLNPFRLDRWVFGDTQQENGVYLRKFSWTHIKRHVLVADTASPDDPTLRAYWQKRALAKTEALETKGRRLAKQQKGICPRCGQPLFNGETVGLLAYTGEELHAHHKQPRRKGGSDKLDNLELLHLFCHHAADAGIINNERLQKELDLQPA